MRVWLPSSFSRRCNRRSGAFWQRLEDLALCLFGLVHNWCLDSSCSSMMITTLYPSSRGYWLQNPYYYCIALPVSNLEYGLGTWASMRSRETEVRFWTEDMNKLGSQNLLTPQPHSNRLISGSSRCCEIFVCVRTFWKNGWTCMVSKHYGVHVYGIHRHL
jgi:hypothetical protein